MFVADQKTRRVHRLEARESGCCPPGLEGADQLAISSSEDVKRMIELEGYQLCPECMARSPWAD